MPLSQLALFHQKNSIYPLNTSLPAAPAAVKKFTPLNELKFFFQQNAFWGKARK
jgi:hypothetical protein